MKKIMLGLIALASLLVGCRNNTTIDSFTDSLSESEVKYQKITAAEAQKIMDEGVPYILLDVRTEEEYKEAHIAGSILLPHTDISSNALEQLPDKNEIILIYCRSGRRSAEAAEALAQMGYSHVYDFGGIIDWPYETVSDDTIK